MKKFFLLFVCFFSFYLSYAQGTSQTMEEVCDSIMKETAILLDYNDVKESTKFLVYSNRRLDKKVGDFFVYEQKDTLVSILIDKKDSNKVLGEFHFYDDLNVPQKEDVNERKLTEYEYELLDIRDKMMASVQENFNVQLPSDNSTFSVIFFPFELEARGKKIKLYKLYLISESLNADEIGFGNDYLFYGKANGKIAYNLVFNQYMPTPILESHSTEAIELEYPVRESYITPTDLYHFRKKAAQRELGFLKVFSSDLGIFFNYSSVANRLRVSGK